MKTLQSTLDALTLVARRLDFCFWAACNRQIGWTRSGWALATAKYDINSVGKASG